MTSTAQESSGSTSDRPRCGCCGQPRARLTELGDTPGVFICAGCALWAARRAGGLRALSLQRAVRATRHLLPRRHTHSGSTFHSAIPILTSTDLQRTAGFYAALGFDIAGRYDAYLLLHDGAFELHFAQEPAPAPGQCFLHVGNAAALWKRLRQEKAEGVGEIADMDYGLREFTVVDPDGNRVRIGSGIE